MSSRKIQKVIKGERAPTDRQRHFLLKLREFIRKSGWTQERVARTGKISQARLNNWLRERNYPDEPNMRAIESALGIEEKSVDMAIAENAAEYAPPLTRAEKRVMDNLKELIKIGDKEIFDHLDRQIILLKNLLATRKGSKSSDGE